MSSLRNSAPRKAHKERSQLQSRAHLGLLEKKKDYVLRAKDYNKKQKRLKSMREKALLKNPDEFYFAMINSKTKDGVHVKSGTRDSYDHDYLKLLKTQDQNYINYHRSINIKARRRYYVISNVATEIGEGWKREWLWDGILPDPSAEAGGESVAKRNKHTVFVDDEDEEESEEDDDDEAKEEQPKRQLHPKVLRKREVARRELESRKTREDKLRQMQQEMQLQKNLMGKGSKKKVGTDAKGLAIYKWKMERKK
ncbi:small-subunit processome [Chytridium lagenaria]|nr:small-subunit processome [Chytridium lagenaria]